jgi:membrane-associated protein
MARFLPIVRTFMPIVAGIVNMDKKKFLKDNVIGAVLWSFILIFAGHYLNELFEKQFGIDLKSHLELIIIIIVAVTNLPILLKFVFSKHEVENFEEDIH